MRAVIRSVSFILRLCSPVKRKGMSIRQQGDDKGLRQVRDVHHVFVETGGGSTLTGQFYSPVCIFGMDAEAGKDFRAAAVA